jgi:hypothetical protein
MLNVRAFSFELFFHDLHSLSHVVVLEHAASSYTLPQSGASSSASTSVVAIVESKTVQSSHQPRMGAYPYPVGAWGYHHFPTFPTPTVPSSATVGVAQGDTVTNIVASGTFPYPYTAVQFSTGQATYVPPIKYPYGAPALPTSTSSAGATTDPSTSTSQAQERAYNSVQWQWKQPYTGPSDPTLAAEPRAPNEPPPSADVDAHELTQNPITNDSAESSTTDADKAAPLTDALVTSTSSTTGVTA